MAGGLDLVRERVARLEALVDANLDKARSLADRLDAVVDGFLYVKDSHENMLWSLQHVFQKCWMT